MGHWSYQKWRTSWPASNLPALLRESQKTPNWFAGSPFGEKAPGDVGRDSGSGAVKWPGQLAGGTVSSLHKDSFSAQRLNARALDAAAALPKASVTDVNQRRDLHGLFTAKRLWFRHSRRSPGA